MLRLSVFAVSALIALTPIAGARAATACDGKTAKGCVAPQSTKTADERVLKSQLYLAAAKTGARGNYRRAAQQLDQSVASERRSLHHASLAPI